MKRTSEAPETSDEELPEALPQIEELEETALERVAAMLQDTTAKDAVVKIYRKNPETARLQWVDEMTPALMEQQGFHALRRRFGPGTYQIIIYGTNPATGRWVRRGVQTVELAEDQSPPSSTNGVDDFSRLIDLFEKRFNAIEARIAAPPPPAPPAKTASESLQEMALLVRTVRELIPAPPPPPDMLGLVEKLGSLVGGVRELRDAIEPTPEPKNPLMAIAAQMLPMIQGAIMNQGQAQPAMLPAAAAPAPAPAAPPAPRNVTQLRPPAPPASIVQPGEGESFASAATAATTPGAEVSDEQQAALEVARGYIEQLDAMASINAQIEPTAEFLYQFIDDETEKMLRSDYWWPMIVNLKPEAAEREKWYRELHARLIEILDEPAPKTAA